MKLNKVLLGLSLSVSSLGLAAEPAPVIDVSNNSTGISTSTGVTTGSMSEQLASLSRKLDARNRAQVNVQRQLDELQNEVNELRGITELHSHQLSQIIERQRELYQELDRRVTQALSSSSVPASSALGVAETDVSVVQNYSKDLTENEAYDRAVNMVLKDKRYADAIPEFQAFNKKYPQSTYSANAHYWLGQLLYSQGDLVKAKAEFEQVVNQYPDSSKRADALLKLATLAQKENNISQAQLLYKKVLSEYPDSSAAKLSTTRLAALQP